MKRIAKCIVPLAFIFAHGCHRVEESKIQSIGSLAQINYPRLQGLRSKWKWDQDGEAFNKSAPSPFGASFSLGTAMGIKATMSGAELSFCVSEDAMWDQYTVSARLPIDKGASANSIVDRFNSNASMGTITNWRKTLEMTGIVETFTSSSNSYVIERTVKLGPNDTEATFKADIETFAERVKRLPRK